MKRLFTLGVMLLVSCAETPSRVENRTPAGDRSPAIKVVPAPAQPKPLVDDSAIELRLRTALLAEPAIKGSNISISANNGEVELRGSVPNEQALRKASAIAGNVSGVRTVRNHLKIK